MQAAVVEAFDARIEFARTGHVDHKTELQEALARSGTQVQYSVLSVEGPPIRPFWPPPGHRLLIPAQEGPSGSNFAPPRFGTAPPGRGIRDAEGPE